MTLKELREKRSQTLSEARQAFDQVKANTDESRAAELEEQHKRAMNAYDDMTRQIEREERMERIEREAKEAEERAEEEARKSKRPVPGRESDDEPMTYRTAFHEYLRKAGNVGAMSEEGRATLESRAQTVGTDSAGGYTVPEELQNMLIRSMLAWGPMYNEDICTTLQTTSGHKLTMPTVDDTAVTAEAATEAATLTDDGGKDVTFNEKQLDSFSFQTEWLRVSLELAQDSIFAMEALLADLLGERMGRIANLQLTSGTGSGAPNGIVTASSSGVTAAATGAVTWDETIDLLHSVDPAYRMSPKEAYMFNDNTLLALRKLKDGDGNYLWQEGNVTSGLRPTINGRRYHINQAMDDFGADNKPIIFGDLGKYYVRKVGAPLIGATQGKEFWPGFGIAGYIRFDGELGDTAAVKHLQMAAA